MLNTSRVSQDLVQARDTSNRAATLTGHAWGTSGPYLEVFGSTPKVRPTEVNKGQQVKNLPQILDHLDELQR